MLFYYIKIPLIYDMDIMYVNKTEICLLKNRKKGSPLGNYNLRALPVIKKEKRPT